MLTIYERYCHNKHLEFHKPRKQKCFQVELEFQDAEPKSIKVADLKRSSAIPSLRSFSKTISNNYQETPLIQLSKESQSVLTILGKVQVLFVCLQKPAVSYSVGDRI